MATIMSQVPLSEIALWDALRALGYRDVYNPYSAIFRLRCHVPLGALDGRLDRTLTLRRT
jgi:hypothetical protein